MCKSQRHLLIITISYRSLNIYMQKPQTVTIKIKINNYWIKNAYSITKGKQISFCSHLAKYSGHYGRTLIWALYFSMPAQISTRPPSLWVYWLIKVGSCYLFDSILTAFWPSRYKTHIVRTYLTVLFLTQNGQ